MGFRVIQHAPEHAPAVAAFRERMIRGGANEAFLPSVQPPDSGVTSVRYERFLVLDDSDAVRGSWLFQRQPFWAGGELRDVANLQAPISEGIVERRFIAVAPWMFRHIAKTQPLVFAVGMGGPSAPLARFLASLGWRVRTAPFLFKVNNSRRFIANISVLKARKPLYALAKAASATGLSSLIHVAQWRPPASPRLSPTPLTRADGWLDSVWNAAAPQLSFAAVRDSQTFDSVHPSGPRSIRLRLGEHAWAVLQITDMKDNSYFGDMRVGTIVDILARPGWERAAASAASRALSDHDVDLLLTNQMHPGWVAAFRAAGFWNGPSNYVFAESPGLAEINVGHAHLTRGDGDGRYHL